MAGVCTEPGCGRLTSSRRCPPCARKHERQRGTRQQRGYDAEHDRLREDWRPAVEAGDVDCAAERCLSPHGRRIQPGEAWDLDHLDDRTGYRGPGHARCNRSAGGRSAHR